MNEAVFKPCNKKQEEFMDSNKRYLLLSGAVAAGKSYLGCWKIIKTSVQYPGSRCLIARKAGTSLRGSTLKTLLAIIPPEMIIQHFQLKGEIHIKTTKPGIHSEIVYSGLDKGADDQYPTKIGSTEFTSIFVDEITEIDEGDWQMLDTRLRYQPPGLPSPAPHQLFGATNPDSPYHFLYKFFIQQPEATDRQVWMTTPYENPHLPKDYIKSLETNLTGLFRERLLHGKWVMAEGIIFENFDPNKQVTNKGLLPYEEYKNLIIGADSNYPLPRAGILCGFTSNGEIHVLEEFYQERARTEALAEWAANIGERTKKTIEVYHDPSDPQSIDLINRTPRVLCEKAHNAVIPGISSVAAHFNNNTIKIHPSCTNLIKELQSYRWKTGREGETPIKEQDHAIDALRYAVYSNKQRGAEYSILEGASGII